MWTKCRTHYSICVVQQQRQAREEDRDLGSIQSLPISVAAQKGSFRNSGRSQLRSSSATLYAQHGHESTSFWSCLVLCHEVARVFFAGELEKLKTPVFKFLLHP